MRFPRGNSRSCIFLRVFVTVFGCLYDFCLNHLYGAQCAQCNAVDCCLNHLWEAQWCAVISMPLFGWLLFKSSLSTAQRVLFCSMPFDGGGEDRKRRLTDPCQLFLQLLPQGLRALIELALQLIVPGTQPLHDVPFRWHISPSLQKMHTHVCTNTHTQTDTHRNKHTVASPRGWEKGGVWGVEGTTTHTTTYCSIPSMHTLKC